MLSETKTARLSSFIYVVCAKQRYNYFYVRWDVSFVVWYEKCVVISVMQQVSDLRFDINPDKVTIRRISHIFVSCFWNKIADRNPKLEEPHFSHR
jgi:hypothetical protein